MTYVVVKSYYMLSWDNAAVILSDCSCAVIEFVLFFWKVRARLISEVGAGIYSIIYHVAPTIVVKIGENCSCRPDPRRKGNPRGGHFDQEIAFFKGLDKLQDRCPDIVICFLMLPDYLFLPYCTHGPLFARFFHYQEREPTINHWVGRVIRVKEYEDPALVAR
mgnify:CR=1 FL=1